MTITELIGQLKRTFATIRLYSLDHENARTSEAQLHQALTAYLDRHGALCLVVRASTLEVDDKKVYEDERKEESLVRPLFVDGVESLTFLAGLRADELSVLVRAWHGAITHTLDAEHSFATWMWEHELASISASIRPGIADVGSDDSDAAKAAEGRLRQVYSALTAAASNDGARVVDSASLAVVRAVLGDVSADALARRAAEDDAVGLGLSDAERRRLTSDLAAPPRGSGQRALLGLAHLWSRGSEERAAELAELVARLTTELLSSARTGEVARAIVRIEDDAFREALGEPHIVATLAKERSDEALQVLAALPPSCLDTLAAPFAEAGPEARAQLAPIIADKGPTGETLATWLIAYGAQLVVPLFELCDALEPTARELLVRAALIHDEPEVVLRGLARVPAQAAADYRSLVEPRLRHADASVRRAALGVFVRSRDPSVPALLEAQIGDPDAGEEWQKSCVHLLGTFGGPSAVHVLIGLIENHKSRELRVAATQALGHTDIPEARRVIEHEAARLIGDRGVKRAAKEVLQRWEKKRASIAPGTGGES